MFQTVKELDWGKLAAIEPRKWGYFSTVMKRDPDATKASTDLIQKFEVFLTKAAREKLGLQDEPKDAKPKLERKDAADTKKST